MNMKKIIVKSLLLVGFASWTVQGCKTNDITSNDSSTLTDVAQTSGQLASGSSFTISGSSSTTSGTGTPGGQHKGPGGPGGRDGYLAGTDLLAPTDQLLAIIEAESAGDFRGMRMYAMGGATVTNYDQAGNTIAMPPPPQNGGGPEGCSFSGKQFPKYDSLLTKVAKTVIDFGSGVTVSHQGSSITRSGKITITRNGDKTMLTETVSFDNYKVNGNSIAGTKTRINAFDSSTGSGSSTTNVVNGKITFSDGTVSVWTSTKQRKSNITLDSSGHPASGTITTDGSTVVTGSDGTVIYSHSVTKTITENIACGPKHHGPVSGTVTTVYNTDNIVVDFGDGSCSNDSVTVTINGVASTKTIGQ
jgi:hypothetical protein